MLTLLELQIIRNLMDSVLADKPNGAVDLAVYMSRVHLSEAIRHQSAIVEALNQSEVA